MPQHSTDQPSGRRAERPVQEDVDLDGMANSMIESSRWRREARRVSLANRHRARVVEAEIKVDKAFTDFEASALERRKVQISRLAGLLREKDEIERRMVACATTLEGAFLSRSAQLKAALDSRIGELQ